MSKPKTKVIVDTDIGTDPDDSLALAYLALNPNCDLLGVTIVTGDVQKRAAIAEVVLHACGRHHVPIHCGRRDPLLKGAGQPKVQQYRNLKNHKLVPRSENTAVDFMRRTIRENPGEVVLLSIGPLSNMALLFALDPEMPSLCKDVVSMLGKYFAPDPKPAYPIEWNMQVDETAAGIVLQTPTPRHRFVGLDVTMQCFLKMDDFRSRLAETGELGQFLAQLADWWFTGAKKERSNFHDPLAAVSIFQPGICEWRTGKVVHTESTGQGGQRGKTELVEGYETCHLVASAVKPDAFFDHFFQVLKSHKANDAM